MTYPLFRFGLWCKPFLSLLGGVCGRAVNTSNSGSGGPGFKPRPLCCFLRQGTLLHFAFLHPWYVNGYRRHTVGGGGGGNPAMGFRPRGVPILLGMLRATETGISNGCVGLWLVCAFTFYLFFFFQFRLSPIASFS